MKIERTIIIDAPAECVFSVITDLKSYEKWNPWIQRAEGDCTEGQMIKVWGKVGNKVSCFQHKILTVDNPSVFHWCDVGWFTLFADGNRLRTLNALNNNKTEYTVTLEIVGLFASVAYLFFGKSLEEGMTGETNALKLYAEQLHHGE